MPTEKEIRESPPNVRAELVESLDIEEVAEILDEQLPIEVRCNSEQYQMWVPAGTAREWIAEELGAE